MSEVNSHDLTEINSAADVFDLYLGTGEQAKAGIEVELSFFDPSKPDIPAMNLSQNTKLRNSISNSDWLHNEPTSELLEVASKAAPFAQMKDILKDTNDKIKILTDAASKLRLKRSYFQELPEKTANDLLSRIVDVERYKIMYVPYRADMKKCVEYFAVCKSNQVSISPKTSDHMLENVRRLYLLAPFLFMLTDNSSGFNQGKPFKNHIGMSMRHEGLTEGRGGIAPYVFSSQSSEEFIENHINYVMNNPLFMYYDLEGKLTGVPSGDWGVTFNSLKARGLNISSNYYLAQSTIWPDVKIATLKGEQGSVTGHRYEARMFGVGIHQHQSALIITAALAFHDDFAAQIDELLERYGFSGEGSYELLKKSYKNARTHGGEFFNIEYGTEIMAGFAKEFASLIENIASDIDMVKEIEPITDICRSGYSDGKVNRIIFPELKDVIEFQRSYDKEIFYKSDISAHSLFAHKLKNIKVA